MSSESQEKQVYVATFGCQMNEYDSERMVRLLSDRGYRTCPDPAQADLIILNTCSIREKAEQKVYSLLGRLRPFKEARPDLVIAVAGCVAQQEGEKLLEQAPYVSLVLGTHAVGRLPELLDQAARTGRRVCQTAFDYNLAPSPTGAGEPGRIKAFLTIMQGCDNFCSYCVVPYVRGREVSRPLESVLDEARDLLGRGVKEITLLGQNVNSYGRGLEPGVDFPLLLEKISELDGLARLRFTTSHPKDLSPRLIAIMGRGGVVCEHLHLPVQSGADKVLAAMRRRYTREDYLALVTALREARPDISLTTDVIVGFPGETEDDFRETMDLLARVRFDGMFSFKYSDRPMTKASGMNDKVEEEVKGRRLSELQAFQKSITLERNLGLIGSVAEVLVEGHGGRYPDQLTGRTRGAKIVNFNGPDSLIGGLARPRIVKAWANSLLGVLDD
ncbi:MAG: tRNA (N6-isopentenyl adenosine(37)-C2)-methylthiotransferase MiaB [Pseudomonadota bacterium]